MAVDLRLKTFKLKTGANALVLTGAVVAIAVLLYGIVERRHIRFDLTSGGQLSLSDQTVSVLKTLNEPVTIRAFFGPAIDYDTVFIRRKVDDLLKEYAYRSAKIDYRLVDPYKEPEQALQFGIKQDGAIVFQHEPNRKDVNRSDLFDFSKSLKGNEPPLFSGEQAFTNAILTVVSGKKKSVYFVAGHGEKGLDENQPVGLSTVKGSLEGENYEVKELNLISTGSIPDECAVLVVAGPKRSLSEREDGLLEAYLRSGGSAVLLIDPLAETGLNKTAAFLGISWRNDIVFDPSRSAFPFGQMPVPEYRHHPVVDPLREGNMDTVFQEARSLTKVDSPGDLQVTEILSTSSEAWGETALTQGAKFKFDDGQDVKGPLTLGYAVSAKEEGGTSGRGARGVMKVVVYGDSDFVGNGLIRNPGNLDLFMNTVAWMAGPEATISIRPKTPEFRNISLTPAQARFIRVFSMGGLPLLVLLAGVGIWWRRRRL